MKLSKMYYKSLSFLPYNRNLQNYIYKSLLGNDRFRLTWFSSLQNQEVMNGLHMIILYYRIKHK
jgi:hypothetical protein